MEKQLSYLASAWLEELSIELTEVLMVVGLARYRVTIKHIQVEIQKESARSERLILPKLKHASGVRLAMLKDRLRQNEQELRELLVAKGYLSDA